MIVTGVAVSPRSVFDQLVKAQYDVLVTDFSMPIANEVDGLEVVRQIRAQFPEVAIVVLTGVKKVLRYIALLNGGVRTIVSKDSKSEEITKAINQAFNGLVFLGRSSAALMKVY